MGAKELIKKAWFCLSLTYRHTTYILRHAEEEEKAVNGILQEQKALCEHIREIKDVQSQQEKAMTSRLEQQQKQLDGLSYMLGQYLRPQNERFTGHYEYWRAKRITAIVEHYGEAWFKGKSVLELGCGYGDIGYVLMTLGAQVTFAEGRAENCDYLRRRFPGNPVYFMNCENEWPFAEDAHFDLVLHMGLLYHLDNLWFALDKACACCDDLVLETEVSDSDDENFILKTDENTSGWDQSLIGHGSRPSGACVEKHLTALGWSMQRVTDTRCNALFHTYDWEVKNTGTWRHGLRRFWFCKKEKSEEELC